MTTVNLKGNPLTDLPEELLWNMTALRIFEGKNLKKLETLPETLFKEQRQLEEIYFSSSAIQQRLPDGLFKGLGQLARLGMTDCQFQHLPNLDSLTVRGVWCAGEACAPPFPDY